MDQADPREVATLWMAAMRRGDWHEAWRQTDRIELARRARQGRPGFQWQPHQLVWDGAPFAGRSVLVRCEHGLGDTLQFLRFIPLVHSLAREVIVRVQPHLLPLLVGAPKLGQVCNGWTDEPPPSTDVQIEVMELAYAFRSLPTTLPAPYPHLAARVAGQPPRLERDGRLRVGLLWSASEWDTSRSIPLGALEPLLRAENVHFYSLQQGDADGVERAAQLGVDPLSLRTQDIASAAAAISQLDLVITVDAMLAHLAGTLGRPTWVLLKHDADWRWMDGRPDSPWYPSMQLWRQPAPGDWASVVSAIGTTLRELAAGRAEVSPAANLPGR